MQPNIGYIILEAPIEIPDSKVVQQRSSNSNRVIAEGTLQDANKTNRNGRDYDEKDLFPALKDARLTELLKTGNLFGEDGHPLDKTLARQQVIYKPLTCVRYLSIWTEGNKIKARYKGTNNDRGEYFDNDLRDGVLPAFSLRALGTLKNENSKVYVKNLRIITWDSVVFPSHACAYTEKIISEGAHIAGMGDNRKGYPEGWGGEISPILTEDAISYIRQESANLKLVTNVFETLGHTVSICEGGNRVQITTSNGSTIRVNLENYIMNEIMSYCCR